MEALSGFQFAVQHLDNRIIVVKSESGVIYRPGDVKAVMEEGMPVFTDPFTKGNLYIELQIQFPERISRQHIEILAKIFPVPQAMRLPPNAQEAKLVSVNLEAEQKKFAYLEASRRRM